MLRRVSNCLSALLSVLLDHASAIALPDFPLGSSAPYGCASPSAEGCFGVFVVFPQRVITGCTGALHSNACLRWGGLRA